MDNPDNLVLLENHPRFGKQKPKPTSTSDLPDHLDLALEFIENRGLGSLVLSSSGMREWKIDLGRWDIIEDRFLKKEIQDFIQDTLSRNTNIKIRVTRSLIDSITELVKTQCVIADHEWDKDEFMLNCANGELRWVGDAFVFCEHRYHSFSTVQIPHFHDPAAECPLFLAFFEKLF